MGCQCCPKQISLMGRVSFDTCFWLKKRRRKKGGNSQNSLSWHFPNEVPYFFNLCVCEREVAFQPATACYLNPLTQLGFKQTAWKCLKWSAWSHTKPNVQGKGGEGTVWVSIWNFQEGFCDFYFSFPCGMGFPSCVLPGAGRGFRQGMVAPPGEGVLPRWVQGTEQGPGCSAGDVVGDCMGWSPRKEAEQRAGDEGDMGGTPVMGLGADERPAADAGISGLAGRGGHGEPVTPVGMGKGTPAVSLAAWGWFCCCVG